MVDRIELLIHMFRSLRKTHGITPDKLEKARPHLALYKVENEDKRQYINAVLDEMFRVMRFEESYENGHIGQFNCPLKDITQGSTDATNPGADTVIYIINRESSCKETEKEESESRLTASAPPANAEYESEIAITQPTTADPEQMPSGMPNHIKVSRPLPTEQQHRSFHEEPRLPVFTSSTPNYAAESKSSAQSPFNYFSQRTFAPVEQVKQPAMFSPWSIFQQQPSQAPQQEPPIYLPMDYGTSPMEQCNGVQPHTVNFAVDGIYPRIPRNFTPA